MSFKGKPSNVTMWETKQYVGKSSISIFDKLNKVKLDISNLFTIRSIYLCLWTI